MTNEEMQRTMQFILEQQAQFAANQQQTDERVTRLETNMAEMARVQAQTSETVTSIAQTQAQMSEIIAAMGRSQAHMNEVVAVMAETHRHTEEKLEAFIGVLERFISEGRNGSSDDNAPSA